MYTAGLTRVECASVDFSSGAFIGKCVRKLFKGAGFFNGRVTGFKEPYYTVEYEDGDNEEADQLEVANGVLLFDEVHATLGVAVDGVNGGGSYGAAVPEVWAPAPRTWPPVRPARRRRGGGA